MYRGVSYRDKSPGKKSEPFLLFARRSSAGCDAMRLWRRALPGVERPTARYGERTYRIIM